MRKLFSTCLDRVKFLSQYLLSGAPCAVVLDTIISQSGTNHIKLLGEGFNGGALAV